MTDELIGIDPSNALPTGHIPPQKERPQKYKALFKNALGEITYASPRGLNAFGCAVVQFIDGDPPEGLEDREIGVLAEQCGIDADDLFLSDEAAGDDVYRMGVWPSAAEQMNLFFAHRANILLVEVSFGKDSISCLMGLMFDGEDLDELEAFQRITDQHMREYRERKAEAKEAAEKSEKDAAEQLHADAELGKKAREHNLVGKLQLLEGKLKKAVKQRNSVAKEAGITRNWEDDDAAEADTAQ
jgi:hypothetical protein